MKVPAVLLVGLLASPAFIAEEKSGCQPGEGVPTFNVIDVTGKYSPNAVCYIWKNGDKPVVLIFAREIDRDLAGLAKEIEKIAAPSDRAEAVIVHMEDDAKASAEKLKEFAKANELKRVALTTNQSGKKSPGGFKLNDGVKFTILVYEKKKVVENFALSKIEETSRTKVVEALKKLLAPKKT